jgi:hypothetical protein
MSSFGGRSFSSDITRAPQKRLQPLRLNSPSDTNLTFAIDSGKGGRPDKRSQLTLNRKQSL